MPSWQSLERCRIWINPPGDQSSIAAARGVTDCFKSNESRKAHAKLYRMLHTPISPRKTVGWLLLTGLLVLLLGMYLSIGRDAQAARIHDAGHPVAHAQSSVLGQSPHRAPHHCNTPLKISCCACLASQVSLPAATVAQAAFPPAPLHQHYLSRLFGPAQPPPRAS